MTPADLASVAMNGVVLSSPEHYAEETGSIIIRFQPAYLNSLVPGVHTLRVTLLTGQYAETTLTVTEPPIPAAGDAAQPGLYLALALLAASCLAARIVRRRRRA